MNISECYYGGKSYRLIPFSWFFLWFSDYRKNTIIRHKYSVQIGSRVGKYWLFNIHKSFCKKYEI